MKQSHPKRAGLELNQARKIPLQDIRIIGFEKVDMPVPEKIPAWKLRICKWLKIEANRKYYTRGYVNLDEREGKFWPGCIIRTKNNFVDLVLMSNVDGNRYLYASVTAVDDLSKIFSETRAAYIGTTQLSQPKQPTNGTEKAGKKTSSKEANNSKVS